MGYTISEVSKKYNISPYTLRYYAKEGLFPYVERDKNGVRIFKENDLQLLGIIQCLKRTGMPIKKIKDFINWCVDGDATLKQRNQLFQEHEKKVIEKIEQLTKELEFLKYKRWFYENACRLGTSNILEHIPVNEIPDAIKTVMKELGDI